MQDAYKTTGLTGVSTYAVAFVPTTNNVIALSTVTASGWAAQATNATLKGTITKCGIYVGSGTAPNAAVKAEGAPACY